MIWCLPLIYWQGNHHEAKWAGIFSPEVCRISCWLLRCGMGGSRGHWNHRRSYRSETCGLVQVWIMYGRKRTAGYTSRSYRLN